MTPASAALAAVIGCVATGWSLAPAMAAEPPLSAVRFDLPAQDYAESLIAIGVGGKLTLANVAACQGRAPPLHGAYTPDQALSALLRAAPCRYDFVARDTVRFERRRPAAAPLTAEPSALLLRSEPPLVASLEQVVVTAQKRPEFLLQTAGSLHVLDASRLAATSAMDVSDLSQQLSAVSITNLGPGRDKLVLRGVSDGAFTGRARTTVASFLDDAPTTYNAPDPDLVLVDVDRIEVLEGPQGALYGGGSIGGVIHVVTRRPDLDVAGSSLQLRGGETQRGAASWGGEATVNLPLIDARLATRLSLYDVEDGGYLQDQALNSSNVDRTDRVGGRVALEAKPAPAWTVIVSGAVQHLATADTQYTTLNGQKPLRRANLVREGHKNDFDEAGLVVEGTLGGLELHSASSYVRHDFTSRYDASAALSLFDAPNADFGAYDETVDSELLSQDIYVSAPRDAVLGGLLGASATQLTSSTPSLLSARVAGVSAPQLLYAEMRTDKLSEAALYGEIRLRPNDHWTVTVDGRVFDTSLRVNATTATPLQKVASRTSSGRADDVLFSPKIAVQYALNDVANLYALASRGDRPGGFNTGGLQAPTVARRTYAPDRLFNYEAGFKASFWRRSVDLQTTVFHDSWRHMQTDQFYSSGLPYTVNVGDGRLTGVETEIAWRPTPRLTLEANALFTTSRIVNPTPDFVLGLRKGLPGAPQAALAAYAGWLHPLPWRGVTLQLSAWTDYLGHSRLTYDATTASTTSSTIVDTALSAQLIFNRYRVALNVRNPGDDLANTFAYGNPFSFGQVRQITPQRPRTVELVATARF